MHWYCELCKHTEHHIIGFIDDEAVVKSCRHCPRCKAQRQARRPVIPRGISALYEKYRDR